MPLRTIKGTLPDTALRVGHDRTTGVSSRGKINEVKSRVDLVALIGRYVSLSRNGAGFRGICPFHDESTPSFTVDREKGLWHCFGCDAGGDALDFLQKIDDISFTEALDRLSEEAGVLGTPQMHEPKEVPTPITEAAMLKGSTDHYDYEWEDGSVLYRVVRTSTGKGKTFCVYRPVGDGTWVSGIGDAPRVLYHLPQLINSEQVGPVLVVEGEKDCDRLCSLGFVSTTKAFGASSKWCADDSEYMKSLDVVLIPDNDRAGEDCVNRRAKALQGKARSIKIVRLPDLPEKGDVSDWLDAGHTRDELLELVEATPVVEENDQAGASTWIDLDNIIGPITWAWEGWLPEGMLTLLVGEPGSGKSALALQIAATFMRSTPWPDGTTGVPELGNVLWCETEAAQALNLSRAKKWGLPLEHFLIPFEEDLLRDMRLDSEEGRRVLSALAIRPDVKLIIVDSLTGAHRNDEKDSRVSDIVLRLAALARDIGKPILLIHHLRKRGNYDRRTITLEDVRGSSAIVQPARTIWALDTPNLATPTKRRLSMIKNNLGPFPPSMGVEINEDGLHFEHSPELPGREKELDRACSFLLELLKDGPLPSVEVERAAERVNISRSTLKRAKDSLGVSSKKESDHWYCSLPSRREK